MITLTTGAIADIIEGETPDRPVLQILSMKRRNSQDESYRLLVSDGHWSSSLTILARHLNAKVSSGEITNNCIIRMNRYQCNTLDQNVKVLIILDLKVLKPGNEVGRRIGAPVYWEPKRIVTEE